MAGITVEHADQRYELNQEMMDTLEQIKNNPGLVIEHAYSVLKRATEGKIDVPNPTNPFSYVLEMSAVQASTLHQAHDVTYRNQYPRLANRYEHLYNHMFDEQYIGRFATPGRAKFDILFKREEVLYQLQKNGENNGVKKIIIPRGSYITVMDYVFTLLYPIVITQPAHGGIDILYQTTKPDPVQVLNTNIVEWGYVTIEGTEYIRLRPTLYNVRLVQKSEPLNVLAGFKSEYKLKDKYTHCRVYQSINGRVDELYTTHSDLIYNASTPTAKLTYLENKLRIEIPSIYANTGLLGNTLYTELYLTTGKVEEPLQQYSSDSFQYQWGKLENNLEDLQYVTPLEELSNPIIIATTMLSGGKDGESFEETRDRVVNYAGYVKSPITTNQLETSLKVGDYDILKARDTITSRSYLATRALPVNKFDNFTAGAASSMETLKISIEQLQNHPDVRDNGRRITITPDMLFKINDGRIDVVYPLDNPRNNRKKLPTEEYIGEINKLQYMFTPFYYVLDPTHQSFDMRAYYMDTPQMEDQVFIGNNETSGYSVSSDDIAIIKFAETKYKDGHSVLEEGYKIRVKTTHTESYQDIPYDNLFAQLAFVPADDKHLASINGKLLGAYQEDPSSKLKEYVWEFVIKTKWDFNEKNALVVHDFYMYLNEARKFNMDLNGHLFFVYGVKDIPITGYQPNEVDKYINREIIPDSDEICGISVDRITYRLGWYLNHFWSNGIPVQDTVEYERHERSIPRVYTRDVYEIDDSGIFIVENDQLKIKHHAGDPILDEHGQPIMFARIGDVKFGEDGMPIIKQNRKLTRLLDIMMIDGVYYFADNEVDTKYRDMIGSVVKDWIVNDLNDISDRLLENTQLFYYPKRTMGDAKLIIDGGVEIQEPMRMSFKVTYYLDEAHYGNFDIREAISAMTSEVINEHLTRRQVTHSDIISTLRNRAGQDIIAVYMDKFGSSEDYKFTAFTSEDPSVRCSVKRLVRLQPDNRLKVVEDIEVNFVKHTVAEELRIQY